MSAYATTSVSTTTQPVTVLHPTCGVIPSSSVRIISTSEPCVVTTHVGGAFEVELRSGFRWQLPVSSGSAVGVSAISMAANGRQSLMARVKGLRSGTSLVSSSGFIVCTPPRACPDLALYWALKVIVTGSPKAPAVVAMNNNDSGRRYNLYVGDRVNLALAGLSMYSWTEPTSSAESVMARTGGSTGHRASAAFVANAPGRVSVMAVENPNCSPACLPPTHLFQVIIIVTKGS